MLFVWTFTLGSGVANDCLMVEAGSGPLQREHHSAAGTVSTLSMALAVDAVSANVPMSDGGVDGWMHRVHCQPLQATERSRPPRQQVDKLFDLDAVASAVVNWPALAVSTDHRFSSRLHPVPVAASLPLFIRFRRLIP